MKEYYYIIGKEQKGPVTINELKQKELKSETLIWTEGMENWKRIKDVPDLVVQDIVNLPPPPPSDTETSYIKNDIPEQLKGTTGKIVGDVLKDIKPNKKILTWLIGWSSFHFFALLMSYSQVGIFNNSGSPRTDQFWPFVRYARCYRGRGDYWFQNGNWLKKCFEGIFSNYDWSEFAFYVGSVLIFFLIYSISKKGI